MDELEVRATDDPQRALADAEAFLKRKPVEHNLVLTLLEQRRRRWEPGRYWTVYDGGDVVGFALQSPGDKPLLLTPMSRDAVEAAAAVIAVDGNVALPGLTAEAATAAAFAGCWSELVPGRVDVREGQRLYHLGELSLVHDVPGALRHARDDERSLLAEWVAAFCAETGAPAGDPAEVVEQEMAAARLFIWDDDGAVSMVRATAGVAGLSRIGFVYTPVELRGRGYALACVGALSQRLRDTEGLGCVLYTQLTNPTSNGIYRKLGYRAVSEVVAYEFHRP